MPKDLAFSSPEDDKDVCGVCVWGGDISLTSQTTMHSVTFQWLLPDSVGIINKNIKNRIIKKYQYPNE